MHFPFETGAASEFRFYEELNDFLPASLRQQSLNRRFRGAPAVKHVVEELVARLGGGVRSVDEVLEPRGFVHETPTFYAAGGES